MRRNQARANWPSSSGRSNIEGRWRPEETETTVRTRSGLNTDRSEGFGRILEPENEGKSEDYVTCTPVVEQYLTMAQEDPDPWLNELMGHVAEDRPTPIVHEPGAPLIEIKPGLLKLLPKFYGLSDEDPYSFLSDFIKVCRIQRRPAGATEDQFKLVIFPFALTSAADAWFTTLPPNSVRTWVDMKKAFLDSYFPSTRSGAIKQYISTIKQAYHETLHDYWTRFRKLVDSCPNHGYSEGDLLKYLYGGMTVECKNLINTSSGGDFCDLTLSEAKRILKKLAGATREYDEPNYKILKKVASAQEAEIKESKFDARVDKLEKFVISTVEKIQETANATAIARQTVEIPPVPYEQGPYAHPYPWYPPYPGDDGVACVNAAGNWYPSRWRDHPNLRYGDQSRPVGYHLQQPHQYQNPSQTLPAQVSATIQGTQHQGVQAPNAGNQNQVQPY